MAHALWHALCMSPDAPQAAPPIVTSQDTILAFLERSKRDAVPLRRTFVQQGRPKSPEPGPLASFVRAHDARALDLYLLGLAVASKEPHDVSEYAAVWARAMDLGPSASANTAVSKAWRRIEQRKLVHRHRDGRRSCVTFLKEDGSGEDYLHPGTNRELYFQLHFAYWRDEWHRRLSLPAKAMLLIALERPDGFDLPAERVPEWYGLSADTAQHGLAELREQGLVTIDIDWKKAALSPLGYAEERLHTLAPPFGPHGRLSARSRPPSGGSPGGPHHEGPPQEGLMRSDPHLPSKQGEGSGAGGPARNTAPPVRGTGPVPGGTTSMPGHRVLLTGDCPRRAGGRSAPRCPDRAP